MTPPVDIAIESGDLHLTFSFVDHEDHGGSVKIAVGLTWSRGGSSLVWTDSSSWFHYRDVDRFQDDLRSGSGATLVDQSANVIVAVSPTSGESTFVVIPDGIGAYAADPIKLAIDLPTADISELAKRFAQFAKWW